MSEELTREMILALSSEDEIDKLVAEKIFGQLEYEHLPPQWIEEVTRDGTDGWVGFFCPRCHCPEDLYNTKACCPNYSGDISAAWEVVEKVGQEYDVAITISNELTSCKIFKRVGDEWKRELIVEQIYESASLAICFAALLRSLEDK